VNSGGWASISFGVPPTLINQPSASSPVSETIPVTWLYTNGGM
jgi:hypothetical protein